MNSRTALILVFLSPAVFFCHPQAALSSGNSLSVVSVEPGVGKVLNLNETLTMKIHYKVESSTTAALHVGVPGQYPAVAWGLEVKRDLKPGEGDVVLTFKKDHPVVWDELKLMIQEVKNHHQYIELFGMAYPIEVRWTDQKYRDIERNPIFEQILTISINRKFPQSAKLYDLLMTEGAENVDWFEEKCSTWDIFFNGDLSMDEIRLILSSCLACTRQISSVTINPKDQWFGRRIKIGNTEQSGFPIMPPALLDKLVKNETTKEEFIKLTGEWNGANRVKLDDKKREQALSRHNASNVVSDVMTAFSITDATPAYVPAHSLIARYKLVSNAADSLGINENIDLRDTQFTGGGLYLNGVANAESEQGYFARVPIKHIDYERFTIALNFKPLDFESPPSSRMTRSAIITGGYHQRWFALSRLDDGSLEVSIDHRNFVHAFPEQQVASNRWNSVACAVDVGKKTVLVAFNGKVLPALTLPDGFTMHVRGGASHTVDKILFFSNFTANQVFHGYVNNLLVYSRALSAEELRKLTTGMSAASSK